MKPPDCPVASAPGTTGECQGLFLPPARNHGRWLRSPGNRTLYKGRGVSYRTPEFFQPVRLKQCSCRESVRSDSLCENFTMDRSRKFSPFVYGTPNGAQDLISLLRRRHTILGTAKGFFADDRSKAGRS